MEDRDLMPFYAQARRIAERAMGEIRRLEARMAAVTSSLKLGYDDAAQPPSDAQRHDIRSLLVEIEAKRDAAREDIERAVIGRLPEDASGDDKRRLAQFADTVLDRHEDAPDIVPVDDDHPPALPLAFNTRAGQDDRERPSGPGNGSGPDAPSAFPAPPSGSPSGRSGESGPMPASSERAEGTRGPQPSPRPIPVSESKFLRRPEPPASGPQKGIQDQNPGSSTAEGRRAELFGILAARPSLPGEIEEGTRERTMSPSEPEGPERD